MRREHVPPYKFWDNIFRANVVINSAIFGQISCKIQECCYLSGNCHVKFVHFVNYSSYIIILSGENILPSKLTRLLGLCKDDCTSFTCRTALSRHSAAAATVGPLKK